MSTILEAPRRVEEDCNAQLLPPAREQAATRPAGDGSRRGRTAMLAAFVGGVVVVVVVLVFGPAGDASDVGELEPGKAQVASTVLAEARAQLASLALTEARAQVAAPAVAEARAPAPSQRELHASAEIQRKSRQARRAPPPGFSYKAVRSDVAVLASPPEVSGSASAAKAEDPATGVAVVASTPAVREPNSAAPTAEGQAPAAAVARSVTRPAASEVAPKPVRVAARKPAPIPKPTAKPATGRSAEVALAPVAELPPAPTPEVVRPLYPEIVVTRTVWHPRAERRTVRVEVSGGAPVELQEGDRVGLLEVGTIEPSGVFFRYGGLEIRRRVGESG